MDILEAEKFITLIKQDKFDYTQWRKNLWEDKSLEEICIKGNEFSRKLRQTNRKMQKSRCVATLKRQ